MDERDEIINAIKEAIERERAMPEIAKIMEQLRTRGHAAEDVLGEVVFGGAIATLLERTAGWINLPPQYIEHLVSYTKAVVGVMLIRAERGTPDASWLDGVDLSNLEGGNV